MIIKKWKKSARKLQIVGTKIKYLQKFKYLRSVKRSHKVQNQNPKSNSFSFQNTIMYIIWIFSLDPKKKIAKRWQQDVDIF